MLNNNFEQKSHKKVGLINKKIAKKTLIVINKEISLGKGLKKLFFNTFSKKTVLINLI